MENLEQHLQEKNGKKKIKKNINKTFKNHYNYKLNL
jgi:hypothetical protein